MRAKKFIVYFLIALLAFFLCTIGQIVAATPQGTFTNWNWEPPTNGYSSLENSFIIEDVTPDAPYFWSHQFQFVNGHGYGGYMGLQSNGSRVNGTVGKTAVFSVFNSGIAATVGFCEVRQAGFDGYDIAGSSCRTAYEWVIGHKYRMQTEIAQKEPDGTWWNGWITDETTHIKTFLGSIKVPPAWHGMGAWSVMWTEYFGDKPDTCDALAYSRVHFYPPTANNGTVKPSDTSNELSTDVDCTNSKITNVSTGTVQEMGNPRQRKSITP